MQMTPVESSNLAAVGFESGTLRVEFKNGGVYEYPNTPELHFQGLITAESAGKYFAQHLRSRKDFVRIQ